MTYILSLSRVNWRRAMATLGWHRRQANVAQAWQTKGFCFDGEAPTSWMGAGTWSPARALGHGAPPPIYTMGMTLPQKPDESALVAWLEIG